MTNPTLMHPHDPRREGFPMPELSPRAERHNLLSSFADAAMHGVKSWPSIRDCATAIQQLRETAAWLHSLSMECGEPDADTAALKAAANKLKEQMSALAIANPKLATQYYQAPVVGPVSQLPMALAPQLAGKAMK